MAIWVCSVCGWEYDEEKGLPDDGYRERTILINNKKIFF